MRYQQPFDNPGNPNAPYVNGNPATGTSGSIPSAEALEHHQRELVHLISYANTVNPGAGVGVPTEADLQQVRKAVEALIEDAIAGVVGGGAFLTLAAAGANLLFYPEVITSAGGIMTVQPVGVSGSGEVQTGQELVWRGHKRILVDSVPGRTFTTLANTTYHLVWDAPDTGLAVPAATYPLGRFSLISRSPASEADPQYDSTYDRMLVARIVTNGSNVLTITSLANKDRLDDVQYGTTQTPGNNMTISSPGDPNGATGTFAITPNWARTPRVVATPTRIAQVGGQTDLDLRGGITVRTRYQVTATIVADYANTLGMTLSLRA